MRSVIIASLLLILPLGYPCPTEAKPKHRASKIETARASESVESTTETGAPDTSPTLAEAMEALHAGDDERAARLADVILESSDPESREARSANYLLKRIEAPPVEAKVVVLLPLTDPKYSAIAAQVQEAFSLGYEQAGGTASLEFGDSGSTAETVTAAMENAVLTQGAMVLVGPLLSAQAIPAAETAEALRVPLLTISRALEDASVFDFVFQARPTVADEIEALLAHTMDVEERTTFATFAPDTTYGRHAVALFTQGVEARGGAVTVSGFYAPDSTDMLDDARTLGRKNYEERASEFRKIKETIEESGGDPTKAVLPPVVDFQAMFLPDRASRVPLACAALAYEEFPLGDFKPNKDAERIPLLGLSGWNHPSLVNSGGPYVRGSLFVDAFITPAEDSPWALTPFAQSFVDLYRESFERTPSTFEAVVADTARLIATATHAQDRPPHAFLQDLMTVSLEDSVTGVRRMDPETHHVERDLKLLSLDANHLLLIEPPASDTEGEGEGETPP